MRENERSNSDDEKQTELIACKKRDEETGQQQQSKRSDQERSADEAPLLADRRENVVVMHSGGRQKAELDLGVRRLETFPGPAAGSNCNKRLVNRPGGTLFVDLRMGEGGKSRLLIGLQYQVRSDGN